MIWGTPYFEKQPSVNQLPLPSAEARASRSPTTPPPVVLSGLCFRLHPDEIGLEDLARQGRGAAELGVVDLMTWLDGGFG